MKWLKISLLSGFSFSLVFSVVSLIFYFGDWRRLLVTALFGLFIGLLAAPEFNKKEFTHPSLFQSVSGAMASLIVGSYYSSNLEIIFLSLIVGGLVGWSASFWLKYIQIP